MKHSIKLYKIFKKKLFYIKKINNLLSIYLTQINQDIIYKKFWNKLNNLSFLKTKIFNNINTSLFIKKYNSWKIFWNKYFIFKKKYLKINRKKNLIKKIKRIFLFKTFCKLINKSKRNKWKKIKFSNKILKIYFKRNWSNNTLKYYNRYFKKAVESYSYKIWYFVNINQDAQNLLKNTNNQKQIITNLLYKLITNPTTQQKFTYILFNNFQTTLKKQFEKQKNLKKIQKLKYKKYFILWKLNQKLALDFAKKHKLFPKKFKKFQKKKINLKFKIKKKYIKQYKNIQKGKNKLTKNPLIKLKQHLNKELNFITHKKIKILLNNLKKFNKDSFTKKKPLLSKKFK
jgi:hypothetical protein